MTLKNLTEKRDQIVSNETIWQAYLKQIKYAFQNSLFMYYGIDEIANAIICELTVDYDTIDIRRALIWAKVNNYGSRSGFDYLTYKKVLKTVSKDAAKPMQLDEFRQEIVELLGEDR